MKKRQDKNSNLITVILTLVVIGICLFIFKYGVTEYKRFTLRQAYEKYIKLQGEQNYDELYKYLNPIIKEKLSKREYLARTLNWKKPTSWKYKINKIEINGDRGIVDATVKYCFKQNCEEGNFKKNTGNYYFVHINGKWLSDEGQLCDRVVPYDNPEEFNRAVSLIIQRYSESQRSEDKEFGKLFKGIRNCLDIKYSSEKKKTDNTEGYFTFSNDSVANKLSIYVSPDYQTKDDIVTATLLVHEMYHALLYSGGNDIFVPCIENEANAFIMSYNFGYILNEEEKNSVASRLALGSSDKINMFASLNNAILKTPGLDLREQFINYVKNNPRYIEQCKNTD